MDEIDLKIKQIENEIVNLSCKSPDGCESSVWPLGVAPPYKASNRHEVIRWDYFNQSHIFLGNDFESVEEMKGI